MKKLVSIVSPCYNGETYISRYLDSILNQTYRPLELILVNDGSTDNTDKIIKAYQEKIENDDIIFKYIVKENAGVGSAVNEGLKYITGEYLIWPDTDDFLYPESIEKRVAFLEEHTEFGFVQSDGHHYNESDCKHPTRNITANFPTNGNLFEKVLFGNVIYNPCGYMLRMSAFLDTNPKKEIFPSRHGQNIQILLPISYKYRCGYLKESLYGRVTRTNSLSKTDGTITDSRWKKHINGLTEISIETLKSIGGDALAYIPVIYYRNLRLLSERSKSVDKSAYKIENRNLKRATKLLIKEIAKNFARGK